MRRASADLMSSALRPPPRPILQRVEERPAAGTAGFQAELRQSFGQDRCQAMNAAGDVRQAFRPVINGVHGGHAGQQGLGGADVAGGLFAADVLLARLQGQAQGGAALRRPWIGRPAGRGSAACRPRSWQNKRHEGRHSRAERRNVARCPPPRPRRIPPAGATASAPANRPPPPASAPAACAWRAKFS